MKKKKKSSSLIFVFLLLLLISGFMLPTALFLLVTMAPTIVAIIMDNAKTGYKWVCIMGMNLAGMLPLLFDLWMGVNDMVAVLDIVFDVMNMIIVYGCAFVGWLMYVIIPPIVVAIISVSDKAKVKQLKKHQELLVTKWGQEVTEE